MNIFLTYFPEVPKIKVTRKHTHENVIYTHSIVVGLHVITVFSGMGLLPLIGLLPLPTLCSYTNYKKKSEIFLKNNMLEQATLMDHTQRVSTNRRCIKNRTVHVYERYSSLSHQGPA